MKYQFYIPGTPKPAKRPRVTRHGTYSPHKEDMIRISFLLKEQIIKHQYPDMPLKGPVSLAVEFLIPIPKSLSKKKKALLYGEPCTSKRLGDLDNLAKICMDSGNNVLYEDDSQIVEIHAKKVYADIPGTIICLETL